MSSRFDAIRRVIDAFERSDWSEIDVRSGDVRVHLSVGSQTSPTAGPTTSPPAAPDPPVSEPPTSESPTSESAVAGSATTADPPATPATPELPAGAHLVVSPSPGIFWRSPEPGAPPFAAVGDTVEASTTVCIVEVMKLMNHVKAGVRGQVVAVYGDNGVAVGKGEQLFAIVPDETSR